MNLRGQTLPTDSLALQEGCYFDEAAANRVRDFFRLFLRHGKGQWAGQPFDPLPWQWDNLIKPVFGWKRADGTRRFRRVYLEVPKKNGKSTLAAGMACYLTVADNEPGAEVYSAAADRDQATIVFREAANMVRASPDLTSILDVVDSVKRIVFPGQRSFYKALSAEANTKEGLDIHGLLFDELHAQKTRELFDALAYGGAARRQPLLMSMTTAGIDRESICYEQHRYAKGVLEGTIPDTSFYPCIYAADTEDDWTNPEVWRRANPSFGVTIRADQFEIDCREAQASPAKENAFRRYRLNQWVEQETRWLSLSSWDACKGNLSPADLRESLRGRQCWAGLDLSATTDLTALCLLFPLDNGTYAALWFFWAPENAGKRREKMNKPRYDAWHKSGHVVKTPGDEVDYEAIRAFVNELGKEFDIREVSIDRWNALQLARQLDGDGFNVIGFGQGYASMSAPTKWLETLVLGKRLIHDGNPAQRWMVGNLAVETDAAGNLKPSKKAAKDKIDGFVALAMAAGRVMVEEQGQGGVVVV